MSKKDKETSFLVFSDDFGEHPSSCQHLFQHISTDHDVLWVNTVGLRAPTFSVSDFRKAGSKVSRMLATAVKRTRPRPHFHYDTSTPSRASRISVCQPVMLPYATIPLVRRFNSASVIRHVRRALRSLGMTCPVLVITAPNACDFIGAFGESRSVYYCVDDFSEWPGMNKDYVGAMEQALMDQCDVLIATSTALIERMERRGRSAYLLTHGVEANRYASYHGEEHHLLEGIPRPRVGYFGLFDERSDKELLAQIAGSMPNVSFVVTGPVETDTSYLADLANFHFTGAIPYSELPSMAHGYDICMLPYRLNRLTNAIQPLKIKEYIATGKPVISTPIREAQSLSAFINLADSPEQWTTLILKLLVERRSGTCADAEEFLARESWSAKAREFLQYCLQKPDKAA